MGTASRCCAVASPSNVPVVHTSRSLLWLTTFCAGNRSDRTTLDLQAAFHLNTVRRQPVVGVATGVPTQPVRTCEQLDDAQEAQRQMLERKTRARMKVSAQTSCPQKVNLSAQGERVDVLNVLNDDQLREPEQNNKACRAAN